jgi:hypothetical protein
MNCASAYCEPVVPQAPNTGFAAATVLALLTLTRSEREALKRCDDPLHHHRTSPPPFLTALCVAV